MEKPLYIIKVYLKQPNLLLQNKIPLYMLRTKKMWCKAGQKTTLG